MDFGKNLDPAELRRRVRRTPGLEQSVETVLRAAAHDADCPEVEVLPSNWLLFNINVTAST